MVTSNTLIGTLLPISTITCGLSVIPLIYMKFFYSFKKRIYYVTRQKGDADTISTGDVSTLDDVIEDYS